MNRIRLLSEQVANQIAAGEVVERPSSVVKELVENSLDAGAARLVVEIHAGGRSLIRVTDDGLGMSRDDALLSLERHATSKILRAEDLSAISTMGFRGEAIPSIASVSRFTLTTRERDSQAPEGTEIVVSGGRILAVKSCGSAPGTAVEVRQLFFNLPARQKFMRADETESAHIQHYLTLAALAFPEVALEFVKDARVVWQLPAVRMADPLGALRQRWSALGSGNDKLLAVDFTGDLAVPRIETGGAAVAAPGRPLENPAPAVPDPPRILRVWGLLGAPGVSRTSRAEQYVFVNRRPVENRGINYALLEGYHTALMKDRYPVCCLFLEVNPAEVDVNIHPAKREVKFHRERAMRHLLAQAVRETLLRFHAPAKQPAARPALPAAAAPPAAAPPPATHQPELPELARPPLRRSGPAPVEPSAPGSPPPSAIEGVKHPEQERTEKTEITEINNQPLPTPLPPASPVIQSAIRNPQSAIESRLDGVSPYHQTICNPQSAIRNSPALLQVPLRLVGVIGRLYVVLESDRGLVLLDQHAAHERVLYEQMLRRLEQSSAAPSQRLLLPETVELPVRDAQFLRQQLPTLTRLGVGLSEFGERTFLLDALPPFVNASDPRRFVLTLVDELKAAGQAVNTLRLGEQTVAKTVCRHAVKAHDPLARAELENLVEDLRHCAMPYTCPHGRPTLIEMNFRELEKKFGRAQ
jgi:DNA mismatch repair protein MutL